MTKHRTVYHVTQRKDGIWQGKRPGAVRASVVEDTKERAVKETIRLAKHAPLGQVRVHRGDGVLQTEYTYNDDPPGRKG